MGDEDEVSEKKELANLFAPIVEYYKFSFWNINSHFVSTKPDRPFF